MNNLSIPSNFAISVPDIPASVDNVTALCKLISQIISIYQQTRTPHSVEVQPSQNSLTQMEAEYRAKVYTAICQTNMSLYKDCCNYLYKISCNQPTPDLIDFGSEELRILAQKLHSVSREFTY